MADKINETNSEKEMRRDDFCAWYVVLGDPEEAAIRAGFGRRDALSAAVSLLRQRNCRQRISRLREILGDGDTVRAGLRRLAFGSCKDAVILAFSEEMPSAAVMDTLDLFNVSEIKRVKGGGVEIKIFDRLKALEKLYELEQNSSSFALAKELMDALDPSSTAEEVNE